MTINHQCNTVTKYIIILLYIDCILFYDYYNILKKNRTRFFPNCYVYSSTLTPMHLRKAKLMFFWVRYPSSAILKMYFPDIKFNKNNTAQLVKWFSNFR